MKKYFLIFVFIITALLFFTACNDNVTITFDSCGGTEVSAIELTKGEPLRLPEPPTKENMYFAGWYTGPDGSGSEIKDGAFSNANITLYAYWTNNAQAGTQGGNITVSFDSNGGKCDTTEKILTAGSKIEDLPISERNGYCFAGWYTEKKPADTSTVITKNFAFTEDITLYATWRKILTIEFSAPEAQNDEILGPISVLEKGTPADLPIPERNGYTFLYWYRHKDNTQVKITAQTKITEDMTLYAKWEKTE